MVSTGLDSHHLALLACPDCRGRLDRVAASGGVEGLVCGACRAAFPVIEGIPVLLPRHYRSRDLEHEPLSALLAAIGDDGEPARAMVAETLELLAETHPVAWGWEDTAHWQQTYADRLDERQTVNWNARLWQRQDLIEWMVGATDLAGGTILDVGCGEGQNFRALVHPHCDETTLYVATDLSLAGLMLNRAANPHANSLYVLAEVEHLPFRAGIADVTCYFGILHHAEHRMAALGRNAALAAVGGFVYVHEGLERPSARPAVLAAAPTGSAHCERIPHAEFVAATHHSPHYELIASREEHTALLGLAISLLGGPLGRHRWVWRAVAAVDRASCRLLRRRVKWFRPGEGQALLRRRPAPGPAVPVDAHQPTARP